MPSKSGGDDIMITGGMFNSALRDVHVHTNISSSNEDRGIKLLYENIAPGAFHNSAERFDAPKCHPQTRKVILKEIMDWIDDLDKYESFLWLYGPAGAGKSAILQSIAELCYKTRVIASFFFSRTAPGRNDARLLIPTLAYQLTISIPEMRYHIAHALDRDPIIFGRSLEAQMETLIFEPLARVAVPQDVIDGPKLKLQPISIIIDGLDECGGSKSQHYILNVLSSAVQWSGLPIYFLVASRPEQDIREAFNYNPLSSLTRRIVLDDNYEPDADIRIFLTFKFDEIKQHHPLKHHLPASWPSDLDMDCLVQKASGQFIYASTVMKFVESSRRRPTDALNVVFGLEPPGKSMPFAELDALYTHILSSAHNIESVTDVLVYLLFIHSKFTHTGLLKKPYRIEDFLWCKEGELQIILANLHSIINVPDSTGDVYLFHASLGDFLMDKTRSGNFYIDTQHAHTCLARYCIKTVTFSLSNISSFRESRDTSYSILMDECIMAYPTEELLQDLWNFNFAGFLNFGTKHQIFLGPSYTISSKLPSFLDWLKNTVPLFNKKYQNCGNDLYTCYIHHFDNFLATQLSCYPQEPILYHLLTALTLLPISSSTLAAITYNMYGFETFKETDVVTLQFQQLARNDASGKYRRMLIAFFGDGTRSGIYHITPSRYISLALKCSENLVTVASTSSLLVPVRSPSLDLLHESLLRAPSNHQLGIYLRNNINQIIPHGHLYYKERKELSLLIDSYTKGCNSYIPENFVWTLPIDIGTWVQKVVCKGIVKR